MDILHIFVVCDLSICQYLYFIPYFLYSPNTRLDVSPDQIILLLELFKINRLLIIINSIVSFGLMAKVHELILFIFEQVNFLKDVSPLTGDAIDVLYFYYCRFPSPH